MNVYHAQTTAHTLRLQIEALQTILDDIPGGPKSPHLCLIRRMAYNAHKHATDLCIFLTDGPTIAPTNGDGQ